MEANAGRLDNAYKIAANGRAKNAFVQGKYIGGEEDEDDEEYQDDGGSSTEEEEQREEIGAKKYQSKVKMGNSPFAWDAKMRKYENEFPTKMKGVLDKATATQNISCGKAKVSSMTRLQYTSLVDDAKKQIFRSDKPYKTEKFELAFVGYSGSASEPQKGPLPIGKCVTVKIVEIDDKSDNSDDENEEDEEHLMRKRAENLIEMRKLNEFYVLGGVQEGIEPTLRRHLVQMFDVGELKTPRESRMRVLASVTELSNDGFHEWIYGMNTYFVDDDEFVEQIRELAWPIREFHQMAMHLDVRPKSYVYVKEKRGKELLKLTNFGNSELTPEGLKAKGGGNGRKRANYVKEPKTFHKFTPEYAGPELHVLDEDAKALISPKSDMWAFGIMLLELLILQNASFYQLRAEPENREELEARIQSRLLEISALYKGFAADNKRGIVPIEFEEYKWPYAFWDALYDILRIWRHFPRTALLITNLLDTNLVKRLTAKGVLDYLDGKCYPSEVEEQLSTGDIRLFNRITIGQFIEKIEEKIKSAEQRKQMLGEDIRRLLEKGGGDAQRLAVGLKERIEQKHASRVTLKKNIHKWTRLRHWLGHALEKRTEAVAKLVGMGPRGPTRMALLRPCDTDTTALDLSEAPKSTERHGEQQWENRETNKQQKAQKTNVNWGEDVPFEWPNKKKAVAAVTDFLDAEDEGREEDEEGKFQLDEMDVNGRRLKEWEMLRDEIEHFEWLQRQGKLLKMPIYEKCVQTVKVDIWEVKKQSEKYVAGSKKGMVVGNVPSPPTMANEAVPTKNIREANERGAIGPKRGKALTKSVAKRNKTARGQ
uniref:Protein kinase domain-containing protein n=1 Tax=Globodera pallida TaxID=36090 RepID=A0A183C2M1_GLOPA